MKYNLVLNVSNND